MEEVPPPPPRPAGFKWWLAVLPLAGIALLMWFLAGRKPAAPEAEVSGDQAFNVAEVPKDAAPAPSAAPAGGYTSKAELEAKNRLGPGPGLAGFVPEKDKIFFKDPKAQEDDEHAREKEMIRKYDPMIREEQIKLSRITRRYYKKEPIVREVDAAFGKLPRYMAVRAAYLRDRDAYAFVRGSLALPEVRKTVYKYAVNGDVWRVTLGMAAEGIKEKPPKPVYDEMKRFMTEDKKVATFVTDLTGYLIPRVGMLLPQALRPGQDYKELQGLAKDLNINGGHMADLSQAKAAVNSAQNRDPRRR